MDTDQHGTVGSGWFRVSGWSMEPSWPSWCLGSDVFPRLGALRSAASDESEMMPWTSGQQAVGMPEAARADLWVLQQIALCLPSLTTSSVAMAPLANAFGGYPTHVPAWKAFPSHGFTMLLLFFVFFCNLGMEKPTIYPSHGFTMLLLFFRFFFKPRHGETHHLYMISIDIPWKPILSTHLQQPQLKCY